MIRNVIVIGFVGIFLALIVFGIARQQLYGEAVNGQTAVPTLAATSVLPELPETAVSANPSPVPPTAVPPTATTTAASPQSHTIQAGETLFSIARRYNIPLNSLAAANNIYDPNLIQVGQILVIPGPTPLPPAGDSAAATAVPPPAQSETPPTNLNGIPIDSIIVMPDNVRQNVRQIFAQGQALGRNAYAYSKVGDSTIQNPHFMTRFDEAGGNYNLGPYAYLQPAIDHFAGSHGREGMAVRKGLHSWTANDPLWADKNICLANETPIICEIRTHNPAFLLIRLGSNDAGVPEMFNGNVRQIVETTLANGIVPIIGTKADRFEGSNINNEILRQIAAEYQLPLWDFDAAAQMIPGRGLDVDNVHLTTFYAHDYNSQVAFQRGHGVHNLTALMMLYALLQEVALLPEN